MTPLPRKRQTECVAFNLPASVYSHVLLCNVDHVPCNTLGKSSSLTGEQAFSILRSNYVRLQEALPVNDILPELFSKAVVTETEFFTLQDLQNQSGEMKQRRELAKYLLTAVRRQQSNFYTLCDILLKTPGVEDLGKKLAADGNKIKYVIWSDQK